MGTISDPANLVSDQFVPAYYDTLIEWDQIEELIELCDPLERPLARQLIMQTLDHTVLEVVLHHLDPVHHVPFLELCSTQHHEPSLLRWIEERGQGVSEVVRINLKEVKSQLRSVLLIEVPV